MGILITGSAGFIGNEVALALATRYPKEKFVGVDNLNNYYDTNLKKKRLRRLKYLKNYIHYKLDILNYTKLLFICKKYKIKKIIHLAAQAGVRYSIENPKIYADNNILGFLNILEVSRHLKIKHLLFASTSSVYGLNSKTPFSEKYSVNHPVSFYGATKLSNEIMAHSYSHLFKIPITGLRFFTVYGPWGRPDMALFKFVKNIIENKKIEIYNYGNHIRDFTYISDIVNGIILILNSPAKIDKNWKSHKPNPASSSAPWRIYNIGNGNPVKLMDYVKEIEKKLMKKAKLKYLGIQKGDVKKTNADTFLLKKFFNYTPKVKIKQGVSEFVDWYLKEYL